MKPVRITLALIAPLSAMAQTAVHGPLDAGVHGEDDLGNGAAAVYTVGADIFHEAGAADPYGRLFGRQAVAGTDGPLGVVRLGRQYNLVGYSAKRYDNTINYTSPRSRSGLIGSAIYSVGASPFNSKVNRAYGATLGYEAGRVYLSITQQRKENLLDATGTTPPVDQSASNSLVAANLDFGRFIGYAAYGHSKGDGGMQWDQNHPYGALAQRDFSTNSRDVLLGVAVPMGATTLLASCIHQDDRSLADRDARQFAVGASYAVSRRTHFYAAYANIQNRNGASNRGSGERAINVGLRHAF